jgi:REP element-mobilizing transposase RayT
MTARQYDFFTPKSARALQEHARRLEHGGDIRKGKRKLARPFDPKRFVHLTMRSERAKGEWSMLKAKHADLIRRTTFKIARESGVEIVQYANSGNHLHILLRVKTRVGFRRFLRTLGALVARIVTGAKKGNPLSSDGTRKFWSGLAWTRIVNWGRHLFNTRYYVIQNELEAEEIVAYRTRKIRSAKNQP